MQRRKNAMSTNQIQVVSVGPFGQLNRENLNLSLRENGTSSVSLLTKKQYSEKFGLKGAALNQSHYNYKRDNMTGNAKLVGAALLTGEIGITRIGSNKAGNGGSLSFKAMSALKEPKSKTPDLAKVITAENAGDVIDRLVELGLNVTLVPASK